MTGITLNRKLFINLTGTFFFMMMLIVCIVPAAAQADAQIDDANVRILIPAIDVDAPIVTINIRAFPSGEVTWDTSGLTEEVGFFEGMAWFGEGGNVVLGGHSELAGRRPAVFYHLDQVAVDDEIIVYEHGTEWRYVVTDVFEVGYRDLSVLYPTAQERLTIMTCDTDSLANGAYSRRVVVVAERVG